MLEYAAACIFVSASFDFLDGFVARLLHVSGELGKQLDSLSDVISFGVLPACILFQSMSISFAEYDILLTERNPVHVLFGFGTVLVAVFSAVRLAKFNIDTRQTYSFIGVPTPANAVFVATIPLIIHLEYNINLYFPPDVAIYNYYLSKNWTSFDVSLLKLLFNPYFYVVYSVFMSYMLISEIRIISLKFMPTWKQNLDKFIFLFVCLILLMIGLFTGNIFLMIAFSFVWYIFISLVFHFIYKHEIHSKN